MGNEDLFDELEETPNPNETKTDDGWGVDFDEKEEQRAIDSSLEVMEEEQKEEERLDSSEVLRNSKIKYSKETQQKLDKFFQSKEIKPFNWTTTRLSPFHFKIMRRSAVLGFVKTRGVFNFYDKKLQNYIRAEKSLEVLFDFR